MQVRELTDNELLDQGEEIDETDEKFRDDYEIKNHYLMVHSKGLKGLVGSDLVMGKFEDKDEKYILALFNLGKTNNQIYDEMIKNIQDNKTQHWLKRGLNEKQKQKEETTAKNKIKQLEKYKQTSYSLFFNQIELLSNLRRNKEDNAILRLASGLEDKRQLPEPPIMIEPEKESILSSLFKTKKRNPEEKKIK